ARRRVNLTANSQGALLEIPGIVSIGQSPVLDSSRTEDHVQFVDTATLVRGNHQFGFGGAVQHVSLRAPPANRFSGIFVFPTLDAFSSGTPDMFVQAFGNPHTRYATNPIALWLQDQWRPAAGVTLIGGFRYEGQTLPAPLGTVTHNFAPRLG